MTKQRKVVAGIAVASFILLYFTGMLWPVVRFCVTGTAIVSLGAVCYFGVRHYLSIKNRESDPDQSTHTLPPLIASSAATLFAFVLLAFIPSNTPSLPTPTIEPTTETTVNKTADSPFESSATKNADTKPTTSTAATTPPSTRHSTPSTSSESTTRRANRAQADDQRAAAEFMGALLGAAAEQDRRQQSDPRYQQFKQSIEAASRCPRCGGAGTYRYVDQNGALQARSCPSCLGSGRAY